MHHQRFQPRHALPEVGPLGLEPLAAILPKGDHYLLYLHGKSEDQTETERDTLVRLSECIEMSVRSIRLR